MKNPLISVCMPNYNKVEYLAEAIESVLNQTYKNLELVIADDGSTDGSCDLLDWYENKDKRVNVIKTKNNGIAVARNTALARARGEFVAIMDSDDLMNPKRLKLSLKAIQGYDFVYGPYLQADENAKVFGVYDPPKKITKENEIHILDGNYPHVTIMAKRACFVQCKYREELNVNDDMGLMLDWYKAGFVGKRVNEALMIVRYHKGSVSATRDKLVKKITEKLVKEFNAIKNK